MAHDLKVPALRRDEERRDAVRGALVERGHAVLEQRLDALAVAVLRAHQQRRPAVRRRHLLRVAAQLQQRLHLHEDSTQKRLRTDAHK